jgi:uncharacterized MAPEG superfamily protein
MRRGRELSRTSFRILVIFCALVLVVALVGVSAGIMTIVSVLSSFFIFIFVPLFPLRSATLAVRRVHRGRVQRAPPRF